MFNIDAATRSDVAGIIAVAERSWWATYAPILPPEQIRYMLDVIYDPELLAAQIKTGDQTYLVIRDGGALQGFVSFAPRAADAYVYKIHKLYVLPDAQKKGYGRALVDRVVRHARTAGAASLDLNVNRFNTARMFYEKLGFRVLREEDVPIGPYWMNDFVMRMSC